MISKKMRNISMVCLSLVLALSLAFGLSSFSSIKKADAATIVSDANGVRTTTYDFSDLTNDWQITTTNVGKFGNSKTSFSSSSYTPASIPANNYINFHKTASGEASATILDVSHEFKDVSNIKFKYSSNTSKWTYSIKLVNNSNNAETQIATGGSASTSSRKWSNDVNHNVNLQGDVKLKIVISITDSSSNKFVALSDLIVTSSVTEKETVVSLDKPEDINVWVDKDNENASVDLPATLSGVVSNSSSTKSVKDINVIWKDSTGNEVTKVDITNENVQGVTFTATAVEGNYNIPAESVTTTITYFIHPENTIIMSPVAAGTTELTSANALKANKVYPFDSTCSADGVSISSSTESVVFYLDKPANVSFSAKKSGSETQITLRKSTSKDGAFGSFDVDEEGKNVFSQSFGKLSDSYETKEVTEELEIGVYEIYRNSGSGTAIIKSITVNYLPTVENGVCTTYNACDLPATCVAPEGYTFVGWVDSNNAFQTKATSAATFNAVFAKADYLGASFKTTGASIRYGFILEIVDINGAALDDTTLATLKSSVTGKFIFTTSQANEIVVKNLGAGTVTSSGVQKTGIIANLVITNMVESQYTAKTTTSISLTINGVEFTANSGAAASAQEKAQAAYNADLISDAVAGNFGITSKTNTDANE